jgi:hypothetical protein
LPIGDAKALYNSSQTAYRTGASSLKSPLNTLECAAATGRINDETNLVCRPAREPQPPNFVRGTEMKIKLALSALAAAFVLGACGGGGGDAADQAADSASQAADAAGEAADSAGQAVDAAADAAGAAADAAGQAADDAAADTMAPAEAPAEPTPNP